MLVEKSQNRRIIKKFQRQVIRWFVENGRTFYWRANKLTPWQWLVLELLLKKTRAETVENHFLKLISKYHEPEAVMLFSKKEVEDDLKPLGLFRQRAVALREIARTIVSAHSGSIPTDQKKLSTIPHVGLYISSAVACFCYGKRNAVVDTNVTRILTRVKGLESPKDARQKWVWNMAEEMLPVENWKEYNFGLLDLGALICKKVPLCDICPVNPFCIYGQSHLALSETLEKKCR